MAIASRPTGERRRGRQPALPSDEEQRVILNATLRVLRRSGFDRATLDEVLAEASLSTRAFYRHYSSKDELLVALYRREAATMAARLSRLVTDASDPADGLRAWVDDIVAVGYEPKRAARAGLLRSKGTRSATGLVEARRAAAQALIEPLVAVLAAGRGDGTFPHADPEADARTIYAITIQVMDDATGRQLHPTRASAVAHVLRFALPALGSVPVAMVASAGSGPVPSRARD